MQLECGYAKKYKGEIHLVSMPKQEFADWICPLNIGEWGMKNTGG